MMMATMSVMVTASRTTLTTASARLLKVKASTSSTTVQIRPKVASTRRRLSALCGRSLLVIRLFSPFGRLACTRHDDVHDGYVGHPWALVPVGVPWRCCVAACGHPGQASTHPGGSGERQCRFAAPGRVGVSERGPGACRARIARL